MSHEIYYTSAPEGLKPGSSGFCTVATSENIPKSLWDRLETLSAYRHHFTTAAGDSRENPVSFAHWLLNIAGANYHVLSRVCDSGVDHTQRTNAFADHLVLDNNELAPGGPAWMLMQDLMADEWGGEVGTLPPRVIPQGDTQPAICNLWKQATGDAGWAGHLADLFVKTPTKPVCILFAPGQDILPLIAEAIALLPASARWLVTFNTYFTSMPTSATCAWRCCLAGSPAAQLGMRYASSGLIIDLTDPSHIGTAPDGPYATLARTGIATATPKKATPAKPPKSVVKPKPTDNTYDFDDEDEEEEEFEFEITPISEEAPAAPTSAVDTPVAPQPKPVAPIKKLKPIMRDADAALRKAEVTADQGAARRRKQFVLLFFAALAALAIGVTLVIFSMHNSGPPEIAPVISHAPVVPTPETIAAAPTPVIPPASIPAPIIPKTMPAMTRPAVVLPPIEPVAPPPPVHVYPALIRLPDTLKKPTSTSGIGDFTQTLGVNGADLDPAAPVTGIRIHLPGDDPTLGGVLAATAESSPKPHVSLRWKTTNDAGPGSELLDITLTPDRFRPSLKLDWKIVGLTSKPDSLPLLYWALQNSTIDLLTARGSTQKIAFTPYAPPAINLLDAQTTFALPADMPPTAMPVVVSALPDGWTADVMSQTSEKNGLLIPTGKVVKFHTSGALDSHFAVTFDPAYTTIACNFSQRQTSDQDDLTKAEASLKALQDSVAQATQNNNGKLPTDANTNKLVQDRDDAQATADAYRKAANGYNDIHNIDISLQLPGKAQVVTFHLRRVEK